MRKIVLAFIALIMFTGCGTSVYYHTELDPTTQVNINKKFWIYLPKKSSTIEEKKFASVLYSKMYHKGFNVSSDGKPDYGITFIIDERSYSGTSTYTSNEPTTSYTYGTISGPSSSSSWYGGTTSNYNYSSATYSTAPVAKTYSYTKTYKKIYVSVIDVRTEETIWTGFMSANIKDYDRNAAAMLEKLTELIGKEFKGDIFVNSSK